jgi:hypothetical protein
MQIANSYNTSQFDLGSLVASLCANGTAAGQQTSMLNMRYTQSGTQQGSKFAVTGNAGFGIKSGWSIALSSDGNTLALGAIDDGNVSPNFNSIGATFIFTRSGTTWTQQAKLVGTNVNNFANQGFSVALSADGNTVAVGGAFDDFSIGAVWVFTRSGTTWTQQGSKLRGTGAIGGNQGSSVSLSADGNTLAIGGTSDNSAIGATWIFTRSGSTWTQQGSKLVGTGAVGISTQGRSVSLSADGNTLAVGGDEDNSRVGATWVFTRSGSTWTQQGSKLVGTGAVGNASQGFSVDVSADGNTLVVGGYLDNASTAAVGAVWVFTRSGTTWSQQGSKLVGTGSTGNANQGRSVALSADGNVLFSGGSSDNSSQGATWIFTRTGTTWTQQGSKLVGTGGSGNGNQGWSVATSSNANTLAVGAPFDGSNGTCWVFV